MSKQHGFTLVELMVVVAVIGILAAVAIPNYSSYVTRGKIPDATSNLSAKRTQMEQYYQDNRTYVGAPACVADATSSKYFNFSCPVLTANTYTIQAAGTGSMLNFTYTVNEQNAKTSTITAAGWTGNAACWATKQDGSC